MTNSRSIVPGGSVKSRRSDKTLTKNLKTKSLKRGSTSDRSNHNPFALPNDEQLLSLYHFEKKYKRPPDNWKLSHTLPDDYSRTAEKELEAKKLDHRSNLMKELKGKGAPSFFSRIRYMLDIRKLAQYRLIVGVKRDGCIQLDQQSEVEQARFLEIKREYKTCVNAMERFLEQDHEASMNLLGQAEAEYNRTTELSERRDELSRKYGSTRLEVYHWEEAWRTVKACHRFLLKVSPLGEASPTAHHHLSDPTDPDHENGLSSKSFGVSDDPGDDTLAYELDYDTSLESLIAAFEKETSELSKKPDKTPAELGLERPEDLLKIFRTIEQQNLNALINLESLYGPMADMTNKIEDTEIKVKTEIDDVHDKIRELEKAIRREEERARRLERQSSKLVQHDFRNLICSEQALRMRVLVEDAYEACIQGQVNETGVDPLTMTHALENLYEQLSAELDRLPRQLVHEAERDGFRAEIRASHEADEAAKKFVLMNRLIAALRRLMEPTPPKHRKVMKRSRPPIQISDPTVAAELQASQLAQDLMQLELFGKKCNAKKALEGYDNDADDDLSDD